MLGYMILFISAMFIDKQSKSNSTVLMYAVPAFHKPMKHISMMTAAVGMTGFYITMHKKAKPVIGKYALLYYATLVTTAFLVVFSAKGTFTTVWPNILAQIVNNAGFAAFIAANRLFLKKITD